MIAPWRLSPNKSLPNEGLVSLAIIVQVHNLKFAARDIQAISVNSLSFG